MKTTRLLRRILLALAALLPATAPAAVSSFDDITFWIGAGTNRAALVIDWHDGLGYTGPSTPGESLAWGFRWDGAATGWSLLTAITAADARLKLNPAPPAVPPGGANTVYSFGYDLDGDGFSYVPGPSPGTDDLGTAGDAQDHYTEGWFTAGFWSYWTQEGSGALSTWNTSFVGAASRPLSNGSWDGWSFAPGYEEPGDDGPSSSIAAVPEPGAAGLLLGGLLALSGRRRRMASS